MSTRVNQFPGSARMEPRSAEVVIAVMGMTGVGKSSFIRQMTGDQSIFVNGGLESATADVTSYSFSYGGRIFRLVDTPGFDDSRFTDDVIVEKLLLWLRQSFNTGTRLNGIIYVHSINQGRMHGTALNNLNMFRELCGRDGYRNVVLATRFWDVVDPSVGAQREMELIQNDQFWGQMYKQGSKVVRIGLDYRRDLQLLLSIANDNNKFVLNAQQEMQNGVNISDTSAARTANRAVEQYKQEMEESFRREEELLKAALASRSARARERLAAQQRTDDANRRQRQAAYAAEQKASEARKKQMVEEDQRQNARLSENLALLQNVKNAEAQRAGQLEREAQRELSPIKCKRPKVRHDLCCNVCDRRIKYGKSFYHCCHCHEDNYDQCLTCGNDCGNLRHPQMLRQTYTR